MPGAASGRVGVEETMPFVFADAEDERAGLRYPKTCTTWQERAAWDAGVSLRGEL